MDPAGTIFGSDTSHHQGDIDFRGLFGAGLRFAVHKAGQGNYADDKFASNSARSAAAGMITAAYWFLDTRYSVAAHLDALEHTVPKTMALIPDVESISENGKVVSAPSLDMTRQFVDGARARGYRVPLMYLPRWYWQSWGSPSLAGLPPLWSSRYPDNAADDHLDEYRDVPASYWDGYGGQPVLLLQFTSVAHDAPLGPYDADAFRGTTDQLAALLGAALHIDGEDEDMANAYALLVPAGTNEHVVLPCPGPGAMDFYVYAAFGRKVLLHQCAFVMETPKTGTAPEFVPNEGWGWDPAKDETWTVDPDRPGHFDIPRHPDGRQPVGISLRYTADHAFTLARG